MPVDPQLQPVLDLVNRTDAPKIHLGSPEEARVLVAAFAAVREDDALATIEDGEVADVPVRWYRPAGADDTSPVLVWFHGGGWVVGSLDTADATASKLAALSGVTVCSVDYRLAPEHPFPAAIDDCDAVVAALAGRPLAVGGDSAGANLAAVVCLLARDRGGPPIALQALVYPVTDLSMSQRSYVDNADGYFLTADAMRWFIDHYVPDVADRKDWRCAPLLAASLEGLPPAIVLTAEYDPLRDEGEAYAERLQEAGVPVELTRYGGAIHGFFSLAGVDAADRARTRVGRAVRAALA